MVLDRKVTFYVVLGGVLSALLPIISAVLPIGMLTAFLVTFPLFFIGLSLGVKELLLASIIAMLTTFAISNTANVIIFSFIYVMPVFILVRQSLLSRTINSNDIQWYPEGNIIVLLSILGGAFAFILSTYFINNSELIINELSHFISGRFSRKVSVEEIKLMQYFLPGLVVFSWMIMLIVNGILAQNLLVRLKLNLRDNFSMCEIVLPEWFVWLFIVVCSLSLFLKNLSFGLITTNITFVMIVPFMFVGFSIIHTFCYTKKNPVILLSIFYVSMLLLSGLIFIIVALGVIEPWIKLRKMIIERCK